MSVFNKVKKIEAKASLKGKAKRRELAKADAGDSGSDDEERDVSALRAQAGSAKEAKRAVQQMKNKKNAASDSATWEAGDDAAVSDLNKIAAAGSDMSGLSSKLRRKARRLRQSRGEEDDSGSESDDDEKSNGDDAKAPQSEAAAEAAAAAAVQVNFSEPDKWVERMALVATKSLPADLDPNDDPKREEVFLTHGLISVMRGLSLLEKAKVPWQRPADYYAEMFKTDVLMDKIRAKIVESKTNVQEQAHRRAMKDQKKFGKEVQAEVIRQRAKHKRDLDDRLAEWKKKKKRNGGGLDTQRDLKQLVNDDGPEDTSYYRGGGIRGAEIADKDSRKGARRAGGGAGSAGGKKSLRPGGAGKGKGNGSGKSRPGKNSRRRK